jgi:hypothetical protein
MRARALKSSALTLIQQLRANLGDRYPRESILKELVQNAEDARASELHLGLSSGLLRAAHQLLQGPALFVVNDGAFTAEDAEAIAYFGLNFKAGDRTAIGKFGFGLKSVFRLCEVFFYFSSATPGGPDDPPFNGLVNPWAETRYHRDWAEFPDELCDQVRAHLGPLLQSPQWFCLWLPLRRREHCTECSPIHMDFPGDPCSGDRPTLPADLLGPGVAPQLAGMLPLLRHLQTIRVWAAWDGPSSCAGPTFAVQVASEEPAQRSLYPDCFRDPAPLGGRVGIACSATAPVPLAFAGRQSRVAGLESFRDREGWPRAFTLDEGEDDEPEKAEPHCAACITAIPAAGPGQLAIRHAVFLPLTHGEERVELTCGYDFCLTLHGCFFIDPGRGQLVRPAPGRGDSAEVDESAIRIEWNYRLMTEGAYPLVLPALADLARTVPLTNQALQGLTAGIERSRFFGEHRQTLCREYQWVYRWRSGEVKWELTDRDAPVLELPEGLSGIDYPAQILPGLGSLAAERVLTFCGWPRLSPADRGADWSEEDMCGLLNNVPVARLFELQGGLQYLDQFLQHCLPPVLPSRLTDCLVGLIRQCLAQVPQAVFSEHRDAIAQLVGRLPPERILCLPFPVGPGWACPFLRSLIEANSARRLVLCPESLGLHSGAVPTAAEAAALLEAIPEDHNSDSAGLRCEMALAVLRACPGGVRPEVLDRCRPLRLFRGHEVRDGATRQCTLSTAELRSARDTGTLFTDDRPSLADALSLATGASVLLAPRDVAALVQLHPGTCSAAACAALLSRWEGGDLRDPDSRSPLLAALSSHSPSPAESVSEENRLAVRLLLHGQPAYLRSGEPLLYDRHGTGLWGRLVRAALGEDDQWRLIDPNLAARVPPHRARDYSLEEVGPRTAEDELRRLGPELAQIQFDLTPQDAAELLRCVQDADVLRALPIHEDAAAGGRLRRIGPGCYWEGGVDLPQGLPAPPVLLRRSANVAERAIQDTLMRPVGHADAIRILLNQPEPHRYWRPILDSFYSLGRAVPHEVLGALRSTSWLPGPNGPVAPGSVLHLSGLADVLASLPLGLLQGLIPSSRLLEAGEHPGLQSLADHRLVPPQEEALGLLGEALAEDSRYHIGQSATFLTDNAQGHSDLNSFLQAFAGVPDDVMAVYQLAVAVDRMVGRGLCVRVFLGRLKMPLSLDRLLRTLDFLRQQHEQGGPREHIERAYLWYLGMLVGPQRGLFPDGLRLLSRAGTWRAPMQLCVGSATISPEWRIDERQLELLRPAHGARCPPVPTSSSPGVPTVPQGDALPRELNRSVEQLRAYFGEWERARPHLRPAIGGFLAALGDGPDGAVRQLAERLLRPSCELEDLRERMRQACIRGESPPTRFDTRRVLVEVIDAPTVRVTNLCGGQVEAPLVQSVESLLLPFGDGDFVTAQESEGGRPVQVTSLRLRRVDPAALADRLGEMLWDATREVLIYFYWLFPERDVFAPLIHADSQQLRAAQNLILDSAPLYLGQLGVSDRGALGEAIRQMHQARNLAAQEEVAADHLEPGSQAPPSLAPERKRQARTVLQAHLREPGTQSVILEAIRRKVSGDFAYVPESVPFEILQNADDATVESLDEGRDWFGIWADQGRVAFLHEGRAINQPPVGQPHDPLLGHERDLEKMLVLSSSDKPASEQGLTGKFGLGFKSVFLVCDEPLVRSGGLGFRVLGGIYPEGLTAGEARALEDRFAQVADRPLAERNGTILELPLRDGQGVTFLDRFLDLLPVALVFTRRVRRYRVGFHQEQDVSWEPPVPVPGVAGVAVGLLDGSRLFARQRVLVFDLGERRRFLIGLNSDGLCRLPDEVPTVWVTAPTQIECRVGFALNAPFDLDVGRTQLQREEAHHRALADDLGVELGRCLVAMHEAPWEDVRQALGLRAELTREQFWETVWARFGTEFHARRRESGELALRLLQRALYGQEGVRRLYAERCALPTGLPGDRFGGLTLLGNVTHCLTGCLDEDPGLLSHVEQWPALRRRIASGELVSRSRVWESLVNLLPAGSHRADPVDLPRVIEWELESDPLVLHDRAAAFGALITKGFVESLEGQEGTRLRRALRGAMFVHAGRGEALPGRLLVCGGRGIEEEEGRRAAFAPPDRRLAPEYQGVALDFFLACREHMVAPLSDMAAWARAAATELQQKAVLRYFREGEQGGRLQEEIYRQGVEGTWLHELAQSGQMKQAGYGKREEAFILVTLGLLPPVGPSGKPPPVLSPEKVLPQIAAWWRADGPMRLSGYVRQVYPAFLQGALTGDGTLQLTTDHLGSDREARRRWLSLFILGMMHGIGWGGGRFQQHRSFLELCHEKHWLDVFANPDQLDCPDRWLAVIDDYVEEQQGDIVYYHWLRQLFVGIRAVARRLPDYAEAFHTINTVQQRFSLSHVLRPRQSVFQQRGGVDPPSLARVLGFGSCFVVRELVRGGFLKNKAIVWPHCYAPVRSIRRLLARLGCNGLEASAADRWDRSRVIFEFLHKHLAEDPTFGGSFDIPLWIVSRDEGLRARFLGGTEPFDEPDDGWWTWGDSDVHEK